MGEQLREDNSEFSFTWGLRLKMASSEGTKYPPSEFSQRYSKVLAPDGKLVSPEDVFGEGKMFDKDVEEKTRLAFKVTLKKLEKMNIETEKNKGNLEKERVDQVVECFPNTLPKNLPDKLSKMKWTKKTAEVGSWSDWWEMHQEIEAMLTKQATHIPKWWEYIDKPYPGDQEILESLKRLLSGVLTHPITIGKGTDRPEATMIYAGFFTEILAANPINPIKLTLVSPDPANKQLANDCGPKSPMLINQRCKLTTWDGF